MSTRGHHQLLLQVGGAPPGVGHLYWRVNFSSAQSGGYVSVAEIEFRATPGGANQAVGGIASASTEYNSAYAAINAFDNNPGSEWASGNNFPHWIRYLFPSPVSVQQLAIRSTDAAYGGPNECPKNFTLEYSDNGITWTVAKTVVGETGWGYSELRLY